MDVKTVTSADSGSPITSSGPETCTLNSYSIAIANRTPDKADFTIFHTPKLPAPEPPNLKPCFSDAELARSNQKVNALHGEFVAKHETMQMLGCFWDLEPLRFRMPGDTL